MITLRDKVSIHVLLTTVILMIVSLASLANVEDSVVRGGNLVCDIDSYTMGGGKAMPCMGRNRDRSKGSIQGI